MVLDQRQILVVTTEPISRQMAGPAIRAVELSKQLSYNFSVTVVSALSCDFASQIALNGVKDFCLRSALTKKQLYEIAHKADIIFLQANVLKYYPGLSRLNKYLIVDLYDPYLFSVLAQYETDKTSLSSSYRLMHQVLEKHMKLADFSICASERQRDYWLGRYCSLGRLTPELYSFDRSFRKLIDIVPYGLPNDPPLPTGSGIKGVVSGIAPTDFVLLWGGGIWEWFDPLTVIKAVSCLAPEYPQLKLYFMGSKSPNPEVPLMKMQVQAQAVASALGLTNRHVFFSDVWVPYQERVNFLLDADVAVTAHFDLPETHFSFRSRILDYFWTGLPVLTTCGDRLAEMIEQYEAGLALPYKDVEAWVRAIRLLIENAELLKKYRLSSAQLAQEFQWQKVVRPLINFCAEPYHLPSFTPVRMPSLVERARAVYARGGKDLLFKRSQEVLADLLAGK